VLTLITGGASSGKSTYACRRAAESGARVLYVATCVAQDDAMRAKVKRHQDERPASWQTCERPRGIAAALDAGFDAAVVDCLTLLISQMLVEERPEAEILAEIEALAAARPGYPVYVVTNEVGAGVIPANELARRFAVLQGRANQLVAARADAVVWMVSGLPLALKGVACRS
jgi:adenosylcobinamide kinase / adenosylcobinamide-phosphate guanylyltransferase